MSINHEQLMSMLAYDPATGIFVWRQKIGAGREINRWNTRHAGRRAGSPNRDGYIQINIRKTQYGAHRLAWLYVNKEWPRLEIDHRNGDKADNRIANLREADRFQQMQNVKAPATNTSGFKGVSLHQKTKRWRATANFNGKPKHLGYFATREEAYQAYLDAIAARGEFARAS